MSNGNGKNLHNAFDQAERDVALSIVTGNGADFVDDFEQWLVDNWPLWKAFEREALRAAYRGRPKYSARTITEWLRHEATLRNPEQEFRLNNSVTPSLSRLFLLKYPDLGDFFETRESKRGEET